MEGDGSSKIDEAPISLRAYERVKSRAIRKGATVYWEGNGLAGGWYEVVRVISDGGRKFVNLKDRFTGLYFNGVPVEDLKQNWNERLESEYQKSIQDRVNRTLLSEKHFKRTIKRVSRNEDEYKLRDRILKVIESKKLKVEDLLFLESDIASLPILRMTGAEKTVFDEKRVIDSMYEDGKLDLQSFSKETEYTELAKSVSEIELRDFEDLNLGVEIPVVAIYHRCAVTATYSAETGIATYEPKPGFTLKQALAGVVVFEFE